MNDEPYAGRVRTLFAALDHAAAQAGEPSGAASVYCSSQGVRLRLNAVVANGVLKTLSFRAYGCPHVLAACEWLCWRLEGQPVSALDELRPADLIQALSVPVAKTGRILVVEDAIRLLARKIAGTAATRTGSIKE